MKLGISSYSFGWAVGSTARAPMNEQALIEFAREHGINLLQIGDNLPLHEMSGDRIVKLAADAATGFRFEVGARGLTEERIQSYTAFARTLGAKLIRFVIDDAGYRPDEATVVSILRETAGELQGLRLGIENHDRFPAATLREIVEAVGDDRVGICLDTANSLGAGEGIDAILPVLGPVTINLHIKDFSIERVPYLMGFTVTGRPAGAGMLNIPRLIKAIERFGRCETAVLELWTPPERELELTIAKEARWALESLEYLEPFFT